MDNAIGTLSRFSYHIYFNILPQQNFKEIFSKLTHSPKYQNHALHDNILIWMPPLQVHIYIYIYIYKIHACIVRPNWAIHAAYRVFLKLRNKLSLNPVSIRILEVLKTRSRISKPTFIALMLLMVSLIRCQQKSHRCFSKRNQKSLANFSQ